MRGLTGKEKLLEEPCESKHEKQAKILHDLRILNEKFSPDGVIKNFGDFLLLQGLLQSARNLGMNTTEFPRVQKLLIKYPSAPPPSREQ